MIGAAKKQNVDPRQRIAELFRLAGEAKRAHVDAEKRIERLTEKTEELEAALPGLQEALKVAEYDWRMALGRQEAGEASAEAVAAAEAGIDTAQRAINRNRETLAGVEDLLDKARNEAPGLGARAERSLQAAWRAAADDMEPAIAEAARILRRHYVAILNSGAIMVSGDVYLARTVQLGDVAAIAAELEAEYRK